LAEHSSSCHRKLALRAQHIDRAANNPDDAEPTKTVICGQQSSDKIMVGLFNLVYDPKIFPKELLPESKIKNL
jgi:hypothetical protein